MIPAEENLSGLHGQPDPLIMGMKGIDPLLEHEAAGGVNPGAAGEGEAAGAVKPLDGKGSQLVGYGEKEVRIHGAPSVLIDHFRQIHV